MQKVRVGLVGVGPGSIAQRMHIPSLARIPEAEIVAVASRSGQDIGQLVRRYGAWAEMFAAEELDLVFVMTPAVSHKAIVMAALKRGIAVFCEKPPALTVDDSRMMVEEAKRREIPLLFGFNRRFAPVYVRLKQLAEQRGCHTLILQKTRGQTEMMTAAKIEANNRRHVLQTPIEGTPAVEFMPHLFDVALWINGSVSGYHCVSRHLYGSAVSYSALGYLEHDNGAVSLVSYDEISGQGSERVTLLGRSITGVVTGGALSPNEIRIDDCGQTEIIVGPTDRLEYSGFLAQARYIVRCVAEDKPVKFDAAGAIEALRLALAFDSGNSLERTQI